MNDEQFKIIVSGGGVIISGLMLLIQDNYSNYHDNDRQHWIASANHFLNAAVKTLEEKEKD